MNIKLTNETFFYGEVILKHIMRAFIFLLCATTFGFTPSEVFSQNTKIIIDKDKEVSVDEVFDILRDQTNYTFLYQEDLFKGAPKVTLKKGTIKANKLMKISLAQLDGVFRFELKGNKITLHTAVASQKELQQTITGSVFDEKNVPLPGATIIEMGTTNGAQADFDGNFSLDVVGADAILVVSYIGFLSQEISIGNQSNIIIKLKEDAAKLDEVVVVGYGTAKKKNITGSVISKNLEDSPEAKLPTTNVLQSLRGMSGVNIGAQNSPGTNPSLLVRGQNSINGSNDPLIVLDGIVYLGNLAYINPQDIAKIDVLKDASATAVYGSRAANGVIVVTTKKGKSGKPLISYNTSFGFNTWQNKFDMMDTNRWAQKYVDQQGLDSVDDIVFDDLTPTENLKQGLNTNWMDLISRQGFFQNHQVDVSGSSERFNYYFSGGYNNSEGVIIGDDFERISVNAKLDVKINDWLKVGVNGSYNRGDYSGIQANITRATELTGIGNPYRYEGMPFNANSNTGNLLERWPLGQSVQNPLWGTDDTVTDEYINNNYRIAAYANVKIPQIKGLSYSLNYSAYTNNRRQDRFYYESYNIPEVATDFYFERYQASEIQKLLGTANGYNSNRTDFNYVIDNILNYNTRFGEHNIGATLVATRDFISITSSSTNGNDYSLAGNTSLGINGIQKANNITYSKNITERANIGYLARLNYSFKDRYNLTASVRKDGASVFGADKKWGTFASLGTAWTVSEENFLKGNDIINYFKLKASYGQNGNQGVSPYATLASVVSGSDGGIRYQFGDDPSNVLYGIAVGNLGNDKLGWEKTTSFNGGFSSAFLKNRFFLDLDFYFSKTTDQIFTRNIPIFTGYSSIITSLGQVDNKGLEITLRTINFDKEDFNWQTSFSFWKNRNIVKSLYGDDNDGDGIEDDDIGSGLFIEKSLGAIYGYEYIGVVQEEDTDYITMNTATPGDPMFRDISGPEGVPDGIIDADNDRKILGYRVPNFRLNLSNTIKYKNFTLYALLTGTFGGGKANFYQLENPLYNSFRSRFDTNEVNHDWWTPENKSETYLRPNYTGNRYSGLQSRGFVRIQDVSLSYALPQNVLGKLGLNTLEIFAGARNLHVFSNWFGGGDPEAGIRPFDNTNPVPTTITLGINTKF